MREQLFCCISPRYYRFQATVRINAFGCKKNPNLRYMIFICFRNRKREISSDKKKFLWTKTLKHIFIVPMETTFLKNSLFSDVAITFIDFRQYYCFPSFIFFLLVDNIFVFAFMLNFSIFLCIFWFSDFVSTSLLLLLLLSFVRFLKLVFWKIFSLLLFPFC